jgi:iron-sulfur cluster assembly protein
MFNVTPQAAAQIKSAAPEDAEAEALALRIAARRMPDGEIDYGMGFDEQREFDLEIAVQGVNVLIGPSSRELLEGVTLDYVELEPGQFHFIFIPPQPQAESSDQSSSGSSA